MMNFRTIQILTVFLLVCEIQGFDPNYTETCKCECNGDVCEWDQYCDQSTKKCKHCKFRYGDCYTSACEPCCESFCKRVQQCPMPKPPDQGEYSGSNEQKIQPGTKLEVNCSYGYYNTGVRNTTCRSGRWSHLEPNVSQPFCKQITCIIPQPPAHCTVEFPQNARELGLDSKISFKPENGYVLRGNNSYWTCKPNGTYGKWEGTLPECVENFCKSPPIPTNGGIRIPPGLERFVDGTWITVICNDGFYLKGDAVRQCLPNGSWSFHLATCVAKEHSTYVWKIADTSMIAGCFLFVLYRMCLELLSQRYCRNDQTISRKYDTEQPNQPYWKRTNDQTTIPPAVCTLDVHSSQNITENRLDGIISLREQRNNRR